MDLMMLAVVFFLFLFFNLRLLEVTFFERYDDARESFEFAWICICYLLLLLCLFFFSYDQISSNETLAAQFMVPVISTGTAARGDRDFSVK